MNGIWSFYKQAITNLIRSTKLSCQNRADCLVQIRHETQSGIRGGLGTKAAKRAIKYRGSKIT